MKRTVSIPATALALCACTSRTPQVDSNIELGASVMPYPRQCEWDEVEYMLLPRLFALSCLAWDADDRPDYDTFQKDVQLHQIPILNAWGFNYRNK